MNHWYFRYLYSNDPEKVISRKGVRNRNIINPAFNLTLKILNPYKLHIERKAEIPKDEPTIFVASHGFRDDILNSLLTADRSVYILFGVINQFFKTIDGLKLWCCGVILVNREDAKSRAASKLKMERAVKLGANIMDFFEATWNLSDNLLAAKPHIGIYDVAEMTGQKIAPLTTHIEIKKFRSICHSILDEGYDITETNADRAYDILKAIMVHLAKISDLLFYNDLNTVVIKEQTDSLLSFIQDSLKNRRSELWRYEQLLDSVSKEAERIREQIVFQKAQNDIFYESAIRRSADLLRKVVYAKKIAAVGELRDIIASHKYELIEKYSNYSHIPRQQLERKDSLKSQWEKRKRKLVKQVKYYIPEKEQTYLYKDPTEYDKTEVFACLDRVSPTAGNARVLAAHYRSKVRSINE